MSRIIRLYLFGEYNPVVESQVINWLGILSNKGIITNCISILGKNNQKLTEVDKMSLETRINGSYYEYIHVKFPLIRDIGFAILILKLYKHYINKCDSLIFQCRNGLLGSAIILLKCLPKVTLIFEARASGVIEFIDYSMLNSWKDKFRLKRLTYYEWLYVKTADTVICVSNKLKHYFQSRYNICDEEKFKVVPGLADSNLFYFDAKLSKEMRQNYKLEDRVIFLYSGGIYLPWQKPDVVFSFFSRLYNLYPQSFFLVLTKQIDQAKELFRKYRIPTDYFLIKFVKPEQLNQYYNLSNFGLLFREDKPTNNTASPTKFSEYILSGLPTLITEGVGDFSEFVNENQCGYVLSLSQLESGNLDFLLRDMPSIEKREKIAQLGFSGLSKQAFSSVLIDIMKSKSLKTI